MPVGALPTHEVEKATGELKPPSEFTSTVVPALKPSSTDTVPEEGVIEKSGGPTGARTDGVPAIVTESCVEWVITPFVAATMRL
jgi:hypothetical protein